jgi:aminopeptidase N
MKLLFSAIVLTVLLAGCEAEVTEDEAAAVRSEATTDSSRPLSEGLKAYDVENYTLRHDILVEEKAIAGSASIRFRANEAMDVLELDFDGLFTIDGVNDEEGELSYTRDDAKLYISLRSSVAEGAAKTVTVHYHGEPLEAENAPWDGGFVWSTTPSGDPWVATAIQGEGCDLWWPCKDHPAGEPESVDFYFTVPDNLTVATNGVLVSTEATGDGKHTFHWQTNVATNTYGIALNVGPYVLIESSFTSSNGTEVPLQFWAIEDHEDDARELFEREFKPVVAFFERKVGPYPWGQEKLGVAETPHLGMEHQTINAYGNEFRRGEYGFDWLFHHELAHEWFGNVMTHRTVSDMWLHEGFGAFMQPEYTRELLGDAAFHASMYQTYLRINACNPIAPREEFSADQLYFDDPEGKGPAGDIYSKGTWLLHSLRNLIGEEAFWRAVRRLVYDTTEPHLLQPPIKPLLRTTDDFLRFASEESGEDLSWFFEVYARTGPLPELLVNESNDGVSLEWRVEDDLTFPMPIPVRVADEDRLIEFTENRALIPDVARQDILVDPNMTVLRKLSTVPTCEERRAEEAAAEDG